MLGMLQSSGLATGNQTNFQGPGSVLDGCDWYPHSSGCVRETFCMRLKQTIVAQPGRVRTLHWRQETRIDNRSEVKVFFCALSLHAFAWHVESCASRSSS